MPIELIERFDMFDPGLTEKSFDFILFSVFISLLRKSRIISCRSGEILFGRGFTSQLLEQGFQIIHRRPPILWVDTRYSRAHPSEGEPIRLR